MSEVNVAIVGLGTVYEVHKRAILNSAGLKLAAVCDNNIDRLYRAQNDIKSLNLPYSTSFYSHFDDLLKSGDFDSIHVLLPHDEHIPICKRLISTGKSILCEKPLASSYDEAKKFIQTYRNVAYKNCLCFQNRYNNSVRLAAKLLRDENFIDEYGGVRAVTAEVLWKRTEDYYKDAEWRGEFLHAGGGAMINQSIHTIDLLSYLCGEISELRGIVYNLSDYHIDVEDSASARFKFSSGADGYFHSTVVNSDNDSVKLSIKLERAELRISDYRLLLFDFNSNTVEILTEDDKNTGNKSYYGASHERLIRRFYGLETDCFFDGELLYPELEDGLASLRFIEAVRLSSQSKKLVKLREL